MIDNRVTSSKILIVPEAGIGISKLYEVLRDGQRFWFNPEEICDYKRVEELI